MGTKSIREERRARRKRQKTLRILIWVGIGVVVLIIIGFIGWTIFKPAAGESVPIMANAGEHVEPGTDPGPFNSNPPTSGPHYAQEFDAGFYEVSDSEAQIEFPEGYLIHNLEHGYIIFWYNCDLIDEASCINLKGEIKDVMDEFDNFKVIGFPYSSTDVPLIMTSWGRKLTFDTFNANAASDFVRSNRNRAPEPNAP